MPYFHDSDQFYACAELLFARIQEQQPRAADAVLASRAVFRLKSSDPGAEITVDGRRCPVEISYGTARQRPTLDITLSTDTLHRILLGSLSLREALAGKQLKVRGPVWKARALEELFDSARQLYPQVLSDCGRSGDFPEPTQD
jgi:hypothetical protein